MRWQTRWRWHTGYSADSVEWCPVDSFRHVCVCGTYQLDNSDTQPTSMQTRLGKIFLFTIDDYTTELSPIQTIDTAGVLDQKWCYHTIHNYPILAVVTSIGTIELYRLIDEGGTLHLNLWFEHSIGENILALSVDWSTNRTQVDDPRIVVSDSSGCVTVMRVAGDGLDTLGRWKSHGFEAWIAAFDYWNTNVFYSGGDDCLLKSYDVRTEAVTGTNRSHEAGVTALRSHVDLEHVLLTGSYDEKIRRWDARKLKNCVSETDVNGGIWRLKYHPHRPTIVAAACMYGGFRVMDSDVILSEYLEHESIAYGVDWSHGGPWLATCSFYDCKLHVSEIEFAN